MPLVVQKEIDDSTSLAIWKIEEEESFFQNQMNLNQHEQKRLAEIKGHRRLEWLAGRFLICNLNGTKEPGISVDEYGKPHLFNKHLSISHSRSYAAAIISEHSCGIDIQHIVAKIERIAYKFMREQELDSLEEETRLAQLHVYWGAKECLYKSYGRRQLDFKAHIHVKPFKYIEEDGIKGRVLKNNFKAFYKLRYERREDYMLVYAIEDSE